MEGKKGGNAGCVVEENLIVKAGQETTDSYILYKGAQKNER